MPTPVFSKAVAKMEEDGSAFYGPESFKSYLQRHELKANTPDFVSVDSIDRLCPSLRKNNTMVFRLGKHEGRGTSFGLAKAPTGNLTDYFLNDEQCLSGTNAQLFLPAVSMRDLFPFQLLPKLTETSLVNLAVGSGLLHRALGLENSGRGVVPATGQSTFTFQFRPRPDLSDPWVHQKGQVEVDAIFTASRDGKEALFLVEAKKGDPSGDLAKHKLVYPAAALRASIPDYMPIVPVYLKSWADSGDRHFLVAECDLATAPVPVVSDLSTRSASHWVLRGYGR